MHRVCNIAILQLKKKKTVKIFICCALMVSPVTFISAYFQVVFIHCHVALNKQNDQGFMDSLYSELNQSLVTLKPMDKLLPLLLELTTITVASKDTQPWQYSRNPEIAIETFGSRDMK